jgi:hypothetical protein
LTENTLRYNVIREFGEVVRKKMTQRYQSIPWIPLISVCFR